MIILTNDQIEAILDMRECVAALEDAYRDLGNGEAVDIPRQDMLVSKSARRRGTCFQDNVGKLAPQRHRRVATQLGRRDLARDQWRTPPHQGAAFRSGRPL